MVTHQETIRELVETLESLSESDLRFISRIVRVLGKQESSESTDAFDEWATALARKNRFSNLTEEQVAELVHEYRHQE
jgi:DNA integrity scanning protein DisA with diadenylate cyclase activity